jgi:hypothetical protein
MSIIENYKTLRASIPKYVELVVAAKTRNSEEIKEVINAGAKIIGENYVQEAQRVYEELGEIAKSVEWHMIGHLQRNKVKHAVKIFDMIETVDSYALSKEIDKRCAQIGKVMPILIEINSGREPQKAGVMPEDALSLIKEISVFPNLKIKGIMTMGPMFGNPEDARPYFVETRKIFEKIKSLNLKTVEMKYLSMGMSNSYKIAIEEGSNMVRIGTLIFGRRQDG